MFVSIFKAQPYTCPLSFASHPATSSAFVPGQSKHEGSSPAPCFTAGPVPSAAGAPHPGRSLHTLHTLEKQEWMEPRMHFGAGEQPR